MMFRSKKKGPSRSPGFLPYTKDNTKHFGWCLENKINICVIPNWKTTHFWNVEITINNKVVLDPVDYEPKEALKKMYEYYKYYYEKYNKDEDEV
jgi:hypothetical protein